MTVTSINANKQTIGYKGNSNLVKAGYIHPFTQQQLDELIKCRDDVVYFAKNYIKIVNVDRGLMNFELWPYQEQLLRHFTDNRFVICKFPRQTGKCLHKDTYILLRNIKTGEVYEQKYQTIGAFFERTAKGRIGIKRRVSNDSSVRGGLQSGPNLSDSNLSKLSDAVDRKFLYSIPLEDYQIWTDTGWENISAIHQTIVYKEWKLKTSSYEMICADTHIVFDQNGNERFVKDLRPGYDKIMTECGIEDVLYVEETENSSNMYDVTVESKNHRFYSNGILSHNTSCVVAWLLHYILFNKNVNVAILANKGSTAREILSRLQLAYEWLPKWLQQGASVWNKGNIELANGSKVISAATSSSAVRGYSFNCISGNGRVKLSIENKIYEVTLSEIYENAKLSKYMTKPEEGTYVFGKQIHDLVFPNSGKSKEKNNHRKPRIDGESSHSSSRPWWEERFGASKSNFTGASDITSFASEDGRNKGSKKTDAICLLSDAIGSSGEMAQITSNMSRIESEDVEFVTVSEQDWEKAFGRNKTENSRSQHGKNGFGNNPLKNKQCQYWENLETVEGNSKTPEFVGYWKKENQRPFGQNQQESGEDSEDCRKASGNEAKFGNEIENEFGRAWARAVEQGKEIKVLTDRGYKRFAGIKRTESQSTIRVQNDIECTPEHLIWNSGDWTEAKNLPHTESIVQDVYDLIGVEEVSSFICNDILVHNCIFFDEFAFIPNNVAEEFFNSVYPTISSGKKSRVFIVSTPNGMNKFYKMWTDAKNGDSDYLPVEVNWWDVPGRDEKWKEQTIRNTSKRQWNQEFLCSFLGSSNTLIEGDVLARLTWEKPLDASADETMVIWERPKEGHTYVIAVDISHGQGLDYSAFHVIDITTIPYVQVARYRSNLISPMVFPTLIEKTGNEYNEAYVMIEINDIGSQVAEILHHELGYENLIKTQKTRGGGGQQQVTGGFGAAKRTNLGIKTSMSTKRIGCANLKTLIEKNKLIIRDYETVKELTTFVTTAQSFAAEPGMHDDLAMALVQFGWLSAQRYFREASQQSLDIRAMLEREHMGTDDAEQLFFGLYDDGQLNNSNAGALPFVDPNPEGTKEVEKDVPKDASIQEIIQKSLPNFMSERVTYLPDKLTWTEPSPVKQRKYQIIDG